MGKLIPLIFLAVLVLFFCSASLGTAGDGNRSGFIIGGGIGIGVTYYEYIDY
jgi:hypothetical protein